MKRILLVIAMVFICSAAFSQYVEDMAGMDWNRWSNQQKISYVQGFLSAYSSVWERMLSEAEFSLAEREMMSEWFYFSMSIGDIIEYVNNYYSSKRNLNFKINQVVMLAGGKDYWNR